MIRPLHLLRRGVGATVCAWILIVPCGEPAPVAAQTISVAAPELATPEAFERAAGNAAEHRSRIGISRGVPLERQPTVLLDQVTDLLGSDAFPAGSALLLYSRQGSMLQSWLVDEAGIDVATEQSVPRARLAAAIARYRTTISTEGITRARAATRKDEAVDDAPPGEPASAEASGAALTRILLPPPVAERLAHVRHLVIVPVDMIALAPFALLEPAGRPLIETTSISIAASLDAAIERLMPWSFATARARPLIVGNPALADDPRWTIPSLPGAEDEAINVADMMAAPLLSGEQATLTTIANHAEEASLLYFATHGSSNPEDPLDGGFLMLSAPTLEDGWWTARNIQHRRLAARLAVLSACQTGMGAAIDGGVIGLARAFQLAGVPRVVMSLWSVDDEATRYMMIRFVEALSDHAPAEALRLAMLDTREYFPEPAAWASFTLFGTPR